MIPILNNPLIKERLGFMCAYPKDYTIYSEGDFCGKVGLVTKGEVELVHYTHTGDKVTLGTVKSGQLFGDFLVFSDTPYFPGNIITKTETHIIFIDKLTVNSLIESVSDFRDFYLSNLNTKAVNLNQHNKILGQSSLKDKIIMWLEYEHLKGKNEKVPIKSKEALAQYLNVKRPSLSRTLSILKKTGVLDYDRGHIWLKYQDTCKVL